MRPDFLSNVDGKYEIARNFFATIQSVVTVLSIFAGAIWAYFRYIREEEKYSHIEFSADINIIGEQADKRIIELIATVENKGRRPHKLSNLSIDLNALYQGNPVILSEEWRNQVDFPNEIMKGWFLREGGEFFIGPGVKAKYSYVTCVPQKATFLIFHTSLKYLDRKAYHTAEKTISLINQANDQKGRE